MISDEEIRARLESIGLQSNPARSARRPEHSFESGRRGTMAFENIMDDLLREWELDDEELEEIVEVRRAGDSFEIRLKGSDTWELLEDDDDEEDLDDDSDFGEEE